MDAHRGVCEQARTGSVLMSGMGNDRPYPTAFDYLVWDACQVTNPSIDALREPVETRTFIGRKPEKLTIDEDRNGFALRGEYPNERHDQDTAYHRHMSLGSISYSACCAPISCKGDRDIVLDRESGGLHKDH